MKRRDVRRFGSGPSLLGLKRGAGEWQAGFPYDMLRHVEDISLAQPVTLFAGDNGSGKSTLIEAYAEAFGFAPDGGELERLGELPAVPRPILGGALEPVLARWSRPRTGYFLRPESVFNVAASWRPPSATCARRSGTERRRSPAAGRPPRAGPRSTR